MVYFATEKATQKIVAIKEVNKDMVEKGNLFDHIFREKDIMNETNGHPFISKLYSTCKDETNLYFIIEIASGGNLFELCNDREKLSLDVTRAYTA
jgi:3-phosphoinositide dependent protein kinase-1